MFSEQMVWQFFKLVADDTDKVETLHTRWKDGHIGYIMIKRLLTDAIVEKFKQILTKKEHIEDSSVEKTLIQGCNSARQVVKETLQRIKQATYTNYFSK